MDDRPDQHISDTRWIFDELSGCNSSVDIIKFIKSLKGPYSFIFYDGETKKLWYLRDSLGRNSLLLGRTEQEIFITSATNYRTGFIELPPLGIFCCTFSGNDFKVNIYPWIKLGEYHLNQLLSVEEIFNVQITVEGDPINPEWTSIVQLDQKSYGYDFHKVLNDDLNYPCDVIFNRLLMNDQIVKTCDRIIDLLSKSVQERVTTTQQFCKNCLPTRSMCNHSRVGILFSGGIDCSLIAVLANRFVDVNQPIDLINVAFEKIQNRKPRNQEKIQNIEPIIDWNVPDRMTAIETHKELCRVFPDRKWNLVEVNVGRKELVNQLTDRISALINPLKSVLDESLGAALWFAARGHGAIEGLAYESQNRVLLLGSGADELFGGYTRHRNAFNRESIGDSTTTLRDELELDWIRLPSRNLARDDRVISDHGATPRSPFLQEDFVRFVRGLEPLQKCYHRLEQGVGDKLLLRLCAYRLGLITCATLKKRALQFGSKIADSKQNGKDVSPFL